MRITYKKKVTKWEENPKTKWEEKPKTTNDKVWIVIIDYSSYISSSYTLSSSSLSSYLSLPYWS